MAPTIGGQLRPAQPGIPLENMNGYTPEKLRILILDDHAVVRRGVRQILTEGFDPLEFGEGKAGSEGLGLALGQTWDLIVAIDLHDPGGEGLTELKRMRPDQPILVLTVRGKEGHFKVANNPDELVSAVRQILGRQTSAQSIMTMEVPPDVRGRADHENLSNREREVIRLLSSGRTVKEIAATLGLSSQTISTYRSRLLTKLGLKTTADLIRYALLNRLAD
jgi:two-component system invasion response regulator UvrY